MLITVRQRPYPVYIDVRIRPDGTHYGRLRPARRVHRLSIVDDPLPYYEFLRGKGPVTRLPGHNAVAVTGFEQAVSVFSNADTYSAVNALAGPLVMPFTPEGGKPQALVSSRFSSRKPRKTSAVALHDSDICNDDRFLALSQGWNHSSKVYRPPVKVQECSGADAGAFIGTL